MIDAKAEWTPTMTDEEMLLFDLKGYIVFPAVLSADEIALIKEQCEKLRQDKQSSCTWTQETPRIALFFL